MNKLLFVFLVFGPYYSLLAQEEKEVSLRISGDVVSSYIWRGMFMSGASVQPNLEFRAGRFSLSAWGSVSFNGEEKEIDLTASYSFGHFIISLNDMWWNSQNSGIKYFNYKSRETEHTFESTLSYTLPFGRFPLSLSWSTIFAGMDKKPDGKQAFASYAELLFPFSIKNIELEAICGFTPYKAHMQYETTGFAFTNLALRASREIPVTSSFSLPLFTELAVNPALEDIHFVIGFTIQ